ncbi:hydrogen gas-evolving membrane-bound hydrogenase subunit E [Albibacterium profundi]|uniref:Hydrogen gas-evolving membrane-bound hydrogenase subunit E n=1 Tax=Albibacterium profundi TaxID=3134906 RepID=A0ABV5CC43_9SPHI
MIIAVLSGFLVAILLLCLTKPLSIRVSPLLSLLPAGLFSYFLLLLSSVLSGQTLFYNYFWVPSMEINLQFKVDGLSVLFAMLITGIGFLIFIYSSAYMKGHQYINRFYAYLSMFMASMLGLVLADNLLLLFIFWELTAISSFFLIGFNNSSAASRRSSLVAWGITAGGGFFLMAGLIFIGSITGTYSIQEMLGSSDVLKNHPLYGLILFLFFMGAFTKSAQFPFHFWLPGAMKAPTPVSAYLHSATMVKAGIYLIARFTPILGGTVYWNTTLLTIGGVTMLYAAYHSIFRIDMKSVLAYSTISALGILVFLFGLGTHAAFTAAIVFILVHALYKAGLFLITGVIDYQTGTRDLTKLSGLRFTMPLLAVAGLLAALSSAGIPLTFGFIGKDLIYEATLTGSYSSVFTFCAFLVNVLLACAGYLAGIKPFVGRRLAELETERPLSVLMWLPPLLLGVLGLLFGCFPGFMNEMIQQIILPMQQGERISLKIWHGFNTVLIISLVTILLGIVLFFVWKPSRIKMDFITKLEHLSPESIANTITRGFKNIAGRYTLFMHNDYLRSYLRKITLFFVCLIGYYLIKNVHLQINLDNLTAIKIYEVVVFLIMVAAVITVIVSPSRLIAIIGTGVVGYCICLIFVFFGAPDLAMTQFTIDTLTTVLFVLVLLKLPSFLNTKDTLARTKDGILAALVGLIISVIALQVLNEPTDKTVSMFYADNAYLLAKGKNVVNVILVDFRGYDTFVEITVLTIAAIGVFGMLKIRSSEIE